ncbi:Protoporphyrinogen oxidase-like protein [Cladobotryum mycophilum]|uniref:Protoporphyrinogen oxidase n=1 Tax=Cladobotryum mycophilum TaxID=491253 RepID=A0ABR0S7H7_9HYPO
MGQRHAKDAVASLLRVSSSACRSIALSRSLTNGPHHRYFGAATTSPLRLIRRCDHGYAWTQSRRLSRVEEGGPRIAIVGGGLTGLTAAYYLAKDLPSNSKITLFESSDRLGGWIRTDRVPVNIGGVKGTVSFERGPRTLSSLHKSAWRYDDLVLYDLALDLGLKVVAPPDKPRYVYYPDHLVSLPPTANVAQFIREPLFLESFFAGIGFMLRRLRSRAIPEEDLSIAQWIHQISGSHSVADNMVSAMIHGIYGGDIDKLSARSVLDRFYWSYYLPDLGVNIKRMPAAEEEFMTGIAQDPEIQKLALRPKGSLLHFGEAGMESLTMALVDALKGQSNVEIELNRSVSAINYNEEAGTVEVSSASDKTPRKDIFDKVIATIPSQTLAEMTGQNLNALKQTQSVSIMTNPERALGVFFDSDVAASGPGEPEGTKLFVLMGGHYYDGDVPPPPSEEEAIEQAKSVLERHLGIPRSAPCFAMARFAKDCIPQHFVGHESLMMTAKDEIAQAYQGTLAVAGGSYSKIGAMGAMRNGYDIAQKVLAEAEDSSFADTGLEQFGTSEFVGVPIPMIPVRKFAMK